MRPCSTACDRLQGALGDLRKRGTLDEESISRAMREIRLALLEADVNLGVVKDFTARVRERALGEDVLKSLTPGQQVVKIVHEAVGLDGHRRLAARVHPKAPTVILLAGLQGSGKTTAAAKLALLLRNDGKTARPRRGRPAAGGDRPAPAARGADRHPGLQEERRTRSPRFTKASNAPRRTDATP